ncbi:MAG: catalase, partial [Planctomycetia bacterium]
MSLRAAALLCVAVGGAAAPITADDPKRHILTEDGGQPVGDNQNSRTAGPHGPVTLDNFHLIQKLARFDRERIPERVVHARGVGAHGEFVAYDDLSKLTKAKLFSEKGKTTPVFLRFSTVIHPSGSPETLRDPRGFAVKFYTEDGNWDLVGNNLPVFFIRDAIKFPDMIHSLKPSPITNQQDPNRVFDFFSHVPESTPMLTFVYSDQGTPASLRTMDGFGVHGFKMVNADGDVTYVKFNWRSMQGLKTYDAKEAAAAAARNQSIHTEDLYQAISRGEFPSWELAIQTLSPDKLDSFDFDPLDDTKIWPGIPETKIGRMTLNRIPKNFFQASEQVAFSPGMVVPGIEPSEDRMLQGRLFSYADTQRYRVGTNYLMLPINKPLNAVVNGNQDGSLNFDQTESDVNYQPSAAQYQPVEDPSAEYSKAPLTGTVRQTRTEKTLNFKQAGELYRSFDEKMRTNLIANLAGDLGKVVDPVVKTRLVSFFWQADEEYGKRLAEAVGVTPENVASMIEANKDVEPTKWKAIEVAEESPADAVVLANKSALPIRFQVKNEAGEWGAVRTLLPRSKQVFEGA